MTKKSESVREAEQQPDQKVAELLVRFVDHSIDCPAEDGAIESCDCMVAGVFEAIWEMHHWTAKSVTLKLAEEAGQEAGKLRHESKSFSGEVTAIAHRVSELRTVAAWLREKAR